MTEPLEQQEIVVSNVLQFPLKHPQFSPDTPTAYEIAQQQIADVKIEYCIEAKEFIMENVIALYNNFGYLRDGRRVNTKDLMLLENAIEGIMYRYYRMEHPVHAIAEECFILDGEEEDEESEDENDSSGLQPDSDIELHDGSEGEQ